MAATAPSSGNTEPELSFGSGFESSARNTDRDLARVNAATVNFPSLGTLQFQVPSAPWTAIAEVPCLPHGHFGLLPWSIALRDIFPLDQKLTS